MADPLSAALTIGLTAAQMAITASRRIEGPRLDDLNFTGGDYGSPLVEFWGKRRFEAPVFWAEPLKEVQRRRKTKGGKYNEYTYYGTWAVAVAGQAIAAVTRIWFDRYLVYDTTGSGPVTAFPVEGSITDYFTVYTGTEDQDPDPRMRATLEALHGEGACPAFRGTSYIVFKDVPLEKNGNRIPQVSIEAVSAAEPTFPFEGYDIHDANLSRLWGATFSSDYSRFMWASNAWIEIWDVAARARMIATPVAVDLALQGMMGLYADGSFLAISFYHNFVYKFAPDASSYTTIYTAASPAENLAGLRVLADGNGNEHWIGLSYSFSHRFVVDGAVLDTGDLTVNGWTATTAFADDEGSIWVGGGETGSASTTAHFWRAIAGPGASGPDIVTVTGLPVSGMSSIGVTALQSGEAFVLAWGTVGLYAADRATGAIMASRVDSLDPYNTANQMSSHVPGAKSLWIGDTEISLPGLTELRTVSLNAWTTEQADGIIYDPINHALITSPTNDTRITWRFLDRIDSEGVTLRTIVEAVCARAGMNVALVDATALTQIVRGYSVGEGSGKDWLDPLLDIFDVDARPHGFGLQFVPRGGVAGAALPYTVFATSNGEGSAGAAGDGPPYSSPRSGSRDLPVQVELRFADTTGDQQPNVAVSGPFFEVDSSRIGRIDLSTLVLDPDEAKQLVGRYHRRLGFDGTTYSLALPASEILLEPADFRPLQLPGLTVGGRLDSMELGADRRITTEWKREDAAVALLDGSSGAGFDGRVIGQNPDTGGGVAVPLISRGFVLDVPLLRDVDNSVNPVVYYAAAPYGAGSWPGAMVLQAVDGDYSEQIGNVASIDKATWGTVADALPHANPNVWDRGTVMTINLAAGELAGATEASIDASPTLNLAAIGADGRWEIVQFSVATLVSPGVWEVSGFKRGRRGTEWATDLHQAGDAFLLLDKAFLAALGLSEIGTDLSFKAVTNGRLASSALPIAVAPYRGESLMPYAPCQLEAAKDAGTGDWVLTWVRRTRVGGAWTSGTGIPLGEASEEYEVEILDGDTVVRSFTGLTTQTVTYTAAQQATDGGDVPEGALSFRVFQISAAVDRGFPAALAA